jgi:hypothetical protein
VLSKAAAGRWKSRTWFRLIGAAVAVEVAAVAAFYAYERAALKAVENAVTYEEPGAGTATSWRLFEVEGVRRPEFVPADQANLDGSDEVIGVVAGGRPRAYSLKALRYPPWHIVNDLVGGVPVSVAFCDITDCTQVYTDPQSHAPLDVWQAGLWNGEMIVKVDGARYQHTTGAPVDPERQTGPKLEPIPGARPLAYPTLPWARTTWADWKRRHPETDVFVGARSAAPE